MAITYQTTIVITTPHTISTNDEVVFVNVPLPTNIILPANPPCGRVFYIKDYSGNSLTNPITITGTGGDTIDGASFAILNVGYSHIQLVYDGTNWKTIG